MKQKVDKNSMQYIFDGVSKPFRTSIFIRVCDQPSFGSNCQQDNGYYAGEINTQSGETECIPLGYRFSEYLLQNCYGDNL